MDSSPTPTRTRLSPLRNLLRKPSGAAPPGSTLGPREALRTSVWFGLIASLAELFSRIALKPLADPSPGFFRMNRHIVWTIPATNLVLFSTVGVVLAAVAWRRPRRGVRWPAAVLTSLAFLALLLTFGRLYASACVVLACGVGYRIGLRIEGRWGGFQRIVQRSLPGLILLAAGLAAVSLGGQVLAERWAMERLPPGSSNGPDAPNVLLLVLDTVRADRLSLYGYTRDTTPNLARLARRGLTFSQARSTAPWTLPSHATIMTGRWPHQVSAGLHGPLDATHPTLAEFLSANGYATAGFVGNLTYCSAETGLARGFAHYEDHDLSPTGILCTSSLGRRIVWEGAVWVSDWFGPLRHHGLRKDAARLNRDLLAWIERQGDHPFFAFVNYFDAHSPYYLPPGHDRHFGLRPETADDFTALDRWFISDKKKLTPRQIRVVNDAYDDCIAYLDAQLGAMLDRLEASGQLDRTLVIITADHGEDFGEHGLYGHASSLYDPEIHVPLVILPPRGTDAGGAVAEPVSLRDLPATVADLLGLGSVAPFPGRSLGRCWDPAATDEPEPVLAEVDAPVKNAPNQGRSPVFRGPVKALVAGSDVYIQNGDGVEELYDVAADPGQNRNRVSEPGVADRLSGYRRTLHELTRDDTRPPEWRGLTRAPASPEVAARERSATSDR